MASAGGKAIFVQMKFWLRDPLLTSGLATNMTLECDLQPRQHMSTPILCLWLKIGATWFQLFHKEQFWANDLGMWPWTSPTYEPSHIASMTHVWWQLASTAPAGAIFGHWPWNVTLNHTNIGPLPYWTYNPRLITIGVQLLLQEQFRANDLEMWPWPQIC